MLKYFSGLRITRKTIYVAQTGATITVNASLFRQAWKVLSFNFYLLGLNAARFALRVMRGKPSPVTLAFYPQPAGPWFNAWLAAKMAGLKIIKNVEAADHVFIFDDVTHSTAGQNLSPEILKRAINHKITDISKTHVAHIFQQVFGYGVSVDPLVYQGRAVAKSDKNGTHDGQIINCPVGSIQVDSRTAYQKLIDTVYDGRRSEDLRVIYVIGQLSLLWHKYKDKNERFGTHYLQVDVKNPAEEFSLNEQEKIIEFCQAMGLDFGAIDVLRDKQDGKIYIVDVNKTCMPVLSLSLQDQIKVFKTIGISLRAGLGA